MSALHLTALAAVAAGGGALVLMIGPWARGPVSADRTLGSPHRPGPSRTVPSSMLDAQPSRPAASYGRSSLLYCLCCLRSPLPLHTLS